MWKWTLGDRSCKTVDGTPALFSPIPSHPTHLYSLGQHYHWLRYKTHSAYTFSSGSVQRGGPSTQMDTMQFVRSSIMILTPSFTDVPISLDGLPFPPDHFDLVRIARIGLGVPEDEVSQFSLSTPRLQPLTRKNSVAICTRGTENDHFSMGCACA